MNEITCEITDPASPNLAFRLLMGRSQMSSYLGHLDLFFKVAEVNTVYQFENMITCEIINPASPNLVFELFIEWSRMTLYLGHLDLLSRSLSSTLCISL